jgi:hypothetical protein
MLQKKSMNDGNFLEGIEVSRRLSQEHVDDLYWHFGCLFMVEAEEFLFLTVNIWLTAGSLIRHRHVTSMTV